VTGVVVFVCIQIQLQTVLCYVTVTFMIFMTIFKIKRKLYITSGSTPPPPPPPAMENFAQIRETHKVLVVKHVGNEPL
jgi:hypothetical protein